MRRRLARTGRRQEPGREAASCPGRARSRAWGRSGTGGPTRRPCGAGWRGRTTHGGMSC